MWQDVLMVLWATRVLHWGADILLDFKVQVGHSIHLTDAAGHILSLYFSRLTFGSSTTAANC